MKTIKIKNDWQIPKGFTGIAEWSDGSKEWLVDDKWHRVDGPAWEGADGSKRWYMDGKLHRVDGPAWECANGSKEWWLNDSFVYDLRKPIGDYIVIEEGLPSTMEWLGKPVPTLKVLTAEGIQFIPNLPGV